MEKGYNEVILDKIIELSMIPRDDYLRDVASLWDMNSQEWSFFSGCHSQFREVENIFRIHWHVLLLDKVLKTVIPAKPKFIYRKALNYGDKVVKKVIDQPSRPPSFWDRDGFFSCRKCPACREVNRPMRVVETFVSTSDNKGFFIKEFITCNTSHVVYVLECPCKLMYIGRTKMALKI